MKKQIVHISQLQTAKVMAILYLVISLPFAVLTAVLELSQGRGGAGWVMLVAMPILYALFGFLFTLLGAWVYNKVAPRVGGIEFTTVEVAGE